MPITLNGDTGIQTPMYNGTITANAVTPSVNMKNRIINGAMVIDQRNAGASVSGNNNYTLDRWQALVSASGKYTVQQDAGAVTPPAGFTDYLGVTSSSAYSVSSGDYFTINQRIEGFNTADLGWGSASAKTVCLSFWVRSSLTGTFGGSLRNSASNRSYPFSYTINSANTWEFETITIAGDTSGTWLTTNGIGIDINFSLGAGSAFSGTAGAWAGSNFFSATGATSVVGTNGATFYITGVQLEVGSTATSFDYLDYGRSLIQCQRYFYKLGGTGSTTKLGAAHYEDSTAVRGCIPFPVTMRAIPTGLASGNTRFYTNTGRTYTTSVSADSNQMGQWDGTTTTSGTGGTAGFVDTSGFNSSYIQFSAEL
jgi:hypothetical protein